MNFGSGLQTHSKKAIKTLTLRKSNLLLSITLTLVLFLFLSSLGNAENVEVRNRDTISIQQTDPPDQDDDGLSDQMEMDLGTAVNNKYGDKDNDGLYDFEEYLDYYGNNDTTDGRKYDYDNSTSVVDGVLDIYHYFGLSSNKTTYLRDQDFSTANGGFVDTLLWNVRFVGGGAAGGSSTGPVIYANNTMTDVSFTGHYSGGTDQGQPVSYTNNTMTNVNFGGLFSGGSQGSTVSYYNNTMTDVSFTGSFSGASFDDVNYTENTISDIRITKGEGARSDGGASIYTDNMIVSDRHDSDNDGLSDGREVFEIGTSPERPDTELDGLGDKWEVTYNGSSGVNPLVAATQSEKDSNLDGDGLTLVQEAAANTNPSSNDTDGDGLNDSYELELDMPTDPTLADTDGDGLGDKWELTYNGDPGVNPTTAADGTELAFDGDTDGLNLTAEFKANTDPTSNDTDGDKLADGWEVRYNNSPGVNPLVGATPEELASDGDGDGLNLTAEFRANTNSSSNDTDGDGLNDSYELNIMTNATLADTDGDKLADGWEVRYNDTSGVNPLDNATAEELASNEDMDGLTLTEEAAANTNPSSNDTDGDGLIDGWEVTYNSSSGVNPLVNATAEELASDLDGDGLTLLEEAQANTNSSSNDTDGDGLGDGWEVRYSDASGVNPLVNATAEELASDEDSDDLNLTAEFKANTNSSSNDTDGDGLNDGYEVLNLTTDPTLNDTDGDGLNDSYEVLTLMTNASSVDTDGDGLNDSYEVLTLMTNATLADTDGDGLGDKWEVRYNDSSGVNPLVAATPEELASDTDDDGLSLLEEFKANTDPGTADNPMSMNTTTSTTDTTASAVSSSGISAESSFAFLVVLGLFTSFSSVLVVYRVRRRML